MTTQSDNNTDTSSTTIGQYTPVPYHPLDAGLIEKALTVGDVSKMDAATRVQYYRALCASCGLNPLTRPFILLKTRGTEQNPGGELIWYATVGAAEQLRKLHRVSTRLVSRERTEDGLYIVTVQVQAPDGRQEESQGIEFIGGLKGQALGNAMMKGQSKALRRATLALCGLGMGLAEVEQGKVVPFDAQTGAVQLPPAEGAGTLLTTVGQWFRQRPSGSREAIALAVWGCTLQEMPHLSLDELAAGWSRLDEGRAPLAWDSLTLQEDLAQWQQAHAYEAVRDVFDRSAGKPEDAA